MAWLSYLEVFDPAHVGISGFCGSLAVTNPGGGQHPPAAAVKTMETTEVHPKINDP